MREAERSTGAQRRQAAERDIDDVGSQLTEPGSVEQRQSAGLHEQKDILMLRSIDIDIFLLQGNAGLIHARSRQMRSLMLMGRTEDELWRDIEPVLRDLIDIQGDKVVTMAIDRPGRRVRVDVK